MKTSHLWRTALAVVACAALAILYRGSASASTLAAKQKGMSYAAWWSGRYATPDADLSLTHLTETGAEWISLIVTAYQADLSSTTIYTTSESTPTDADLIHVIERAHRPPVGQRPSKVMLKPHVDLANDPTLWRGEIGAGYDEAQWSAWFVSYRTFIEHYAALAQTHGVEQFCVGTELLGTSQRANQWRQVIAEVRARYSGPITYAANWGGEEVGITWWDAVDTIGVDAYYPVSDCVHKTLPDLKADWAPHVTTLANLAATWHKTILLTEIGYRSQNGSTCHPWDWVSGGGVNCQEQADAYQAVFESVWNQPWLAGIFWWAWGTDPFEAGCCNNDYTPHDKPAEDVLRTWYGGARPAPTPSLQPDYSHTLTIYHDSLSAGWDDWSWNATRNLAASAPVYSGTHAIAISLGAWGGLSFRHEAFDATPYGYLGDC